MSIGSSRPGERQGSTHSWTSSPACWSSSSTTGGWTSRSPASFVSCCKPGHNTTVNGLASAFRYLGAQPREQARLRDDPSLIPAAVDEILRAFSLAQMLGRTVGREVQVGGRTLLPGDRVGVFWASANRDPDAFPDPERIDLTRAPNRHVAFGYGIHRSLGAHLARTEMYVAVEEILARTIRFELVGAAPEIGWPRIGPRSVPVRSH